MKSEAEVIVCKCHLHHHTAYECPVCNVSYDGTFVAWIFPRAIIFGAKALSCICCNCNAVPPSLRYLSSGNLSSLRQNGAL